MDPARSRGLLAWRVPLVAAGLLVLPVVFEVTRSNPNALYQPQSEQSAAPVAEADLDLIREAVVRYQAANMLQKDLIPSVASKVTGVCVGFGRAGGTDPSTAVLAALKDIAFPVSAYNACVKEGMRGRIPLWVVSVSSTGSDAAQAVGRSAQNSYVYALERRQGAWVVTAAKLTGRS